MKLMVTGGRDWRDIETIAQTLREVDEKAEDLPTLIQGCASGADAIARSWAVYLGWLIEDYWPDYKNYEFAEANKLRNIQMVDQSPDLIFAYPTQRSRGTWHAVNYAKSQGYVEKVDLWTYAEQ